MKEEIKDWFLKLKYGKIKTPFHHYTVLLDVFAEKEVTDLHPRTREGIETARLNGKQIGQQPGAKLTTKKSIAAKADIIKYSKDFDGSLNDLECMRMIGIARNTYYKYKRELLAQ